MKIILNILTHGDERIGLRVAKAIERLHIDRNVLAIQIANKKAFESRRRFIDADLNRSFPGKRDGNYEEKLAFKLTPIIRATDLVIDVHSTKSALKDALIVTKFDKATRKYVNIVQPKYVLVMSVTKSNALISAAKVGIAFEYGKDKDKGVASKIVADIKRILASLNLIDANFRAKKTRTTYFDVFATVKKPSGYTLVKSIKNYKKVRAGERFAQNGAAYLTAKDDFYPILFGNKNYPDIFGFRAKLIRG